MKKILLLILFLPSLAFGQVFTRNDNAFDGTGYVVGNGNHTNSMGAVDSNGRLGVVVVDSQSGKSAVITVTQTVAASAHSAGDAVGGLITLSDAVRSSALSGIIQSVSVTDKAGNAGSYDIVFFTANPTATTVTDDAAFTLNDADITKVICMAPISTVSTFADNGVTNTTGVGCPFEVASGTTIYAALINRSAATYASTSDVSVRVSIMQD